MIYRWEVATLKKYSLSAENVCQIKYTPLYKKSIKQNQNKPMETTIRKKIQLYNLCTLVSSTNSKSVTVSEPKKQKQ